MLNKPRFVKYRAQDGWRWHLQHRNGRIIAESGEAYTRRASLDRAIDSIVVAIFDADIVDMSDSEAA